MVILICSTYIRAEPKSKITEDLRNLKMVLMHLVTWLFNVIIQHQIFMVTFYVNKKIETVTFKLFKIKKYMLVYNIIKYVS